MRGLPEPDDTTDFRIVALRASTGAHASSSSSWPPASSRSTKASMRSGGSSSSACRCCSSSSAGPPGWSSGARFGPSRPSAPGRGLLLARSVPAGARTEHRRRGRAAGDDHERHARSPPAVRRAPTGLRGRRLPRAPEPDRLEPGRARGRRRPSGDHRLVGHGRRPARRQRTHGAPGSRPPVPGAGRRPRRRRRLVLPSISTTSCAPRSSACEFALARASWRRRSRPWR